MTSSEKLLLLDCTLRDGGFVNDWQFKDAHTIAMIDALAEAGVEIIEVGYLKADAKLKRIKDLTVFNTLAQANELIAQTQMAKQKTNSHLVIMIDFGTYAAADIPPANTPGNHISGIRLVFHKKEYPAGIEMAKEIMAKGYQVFIQPMVTSFYTDLELLDLINRSNEIDPYAFYIVDSFGFLDSAELRRMYYLVNRNLKKTIRLGLHLHNNLQLAFSNALDFLGVAGDRQIVIDSSVFGMGRGAGNLNTELFADYLNKNEGKNYQIMPVLQIIDNFLESIYRENYWGYSVAHFLSAINRTHPNNASYLVNKKTLSVASIKEILDAMEPAKRSGYDKKYLDELYFDYRSKNASVVHFDPKVFENRDVVIIASGKSALLEDDKLKGHIERNQSLTLSVNHVSSIVDADFYFFSNQKRYDEFELQITDSSKLIITSNIQAAYNHQNGLQVVDYNKLLNPEHEQIDNVTIHLLNLLIQSGVPSVSLAGFDGYNVEGGSNYAYKEYNKVLDRKELMAQNESLAKIVQTLAQKIRIRFITTSIFSRQLPVSVLGVIPARYKSTRFEGKPLAQIAGVPMLERTYNQAKKANLLDEIVVATDSDQIREFCESKNIPVVMTSAQCLTGTDRLAEVAQKLEYDLYINIQGDEPVISPEAIDQIIGLYREHKDQYIVFNMYKKIEDPEEVQSPTIIKTVVNELGELVYMSRAAVPFSKTGQTPNFYKQVCVYGFTAEALEIFGSTGKTCNEQFEDIEILRFIDRGYKVKMIETTHDSIAVDVPEDIIKVERFLAKAAALA